MKIILHKAQNLGEIKQAFSKEFPFLKIEFFKNNRLLKDNLMNDEDKLFFPEAPASVTVDPDISVEKYETLMHKLTGLHIQIFRKSGNGWLMTTTSDHLSISEMNAEAEDALHNGSTQDPKDFDDYHEQL